MMNNEHASPITDKLEWNADELRRINEVDMVVPAHVCRMLEIECSRLRRLVAYKDEMIEYWRSRDNRSIQNIRQLEQEIETLKEQ